MIRGIILVDPFLIYSESADEYLTYLIAIDLEKNASEYLNKSDDLRYIEIKALKEVAIHDGIYKSIEYEVVPGFEHKLPRIIHSENFEG